jgi:predicted  nucleic acid-binding Zn-ribbon protein
MADKIKISCTRCKAHFSERVGRLREGYQGQCPSCGCFINFTAESMDPNVRRAMTEARRIRNGFMFRHPEETSERA